MNGELIESGYVCDPTVLSEVGKQKITVQYGLTTVEFEVVVENTSTVLEETKNNRVVLIIVVSASCLILFGSAILLILRKKKINSLESCVDENVAVIDTDTDIEQGNDQTQ